jgi:hypothetical protein
MPVWIIILLCNLSICYFAGAKEKLNNIPMLPMLTIVFISWYHMSDQVRCKGYYIT